MPAPPLMVSARLLPETVSFPPPVLIRIWEPVTSARPH
ncbi:hypothetical protein AM1_1241 [Acaryochloris marina MBIC11017]|uniref:Uncharacterized protein n=1 Tax=Acaryochloris marina (strain MBIC 11017) TaxID=329726 RepID=B0C418_ACAM1|nr:hypothetical protein AM1_1241 [Acaryochloris marina MBIC11017]